MESTSFSGSASKAVVGVALAVVFGTGTYIYTVRDAHQQAAQTPAALARAPAPAAPPAADPTLAPPGTTQQGPVDQTPPAAAPAPAPSVAQSDAATTPATPAATDSGSDNVTPIKPKASSHHTAKRASDSKSDADSVASTRQPASGSADTSSANSPNTTADNSAAPPPVAAAPQAAVPPPVASTDAPQAPAAAAQEAPNSDSKISSDVKTQIAAAAPNSNVNVTTTNGVVALAGSVPNQDALNQAKQAAQSVEGVKTVDTSGLLVSNNQ